MSTLLDPHNLLETFGALGLFLVVFAESGLLIGFFLPGDSLLFTAGLLVSQGEYVSLPLPVVLAGVAIAAIAGDQVGYAFGKRVGPALFRRPDSKLFKQEYVEKAESYFEKYGSRTIIMARFIPIVRTFAPIVAGVSSMQYRTFVTYNIVGGLIWGVGVTTAGYILGETIPDIDKYLLPIIGVIVLLSVAPIAIEIIRARRGHNSQTVDK